MRSTSSDASSVRSPKQAELSVSATKRSSVHHSTLHSKSYLKTIGIAIAFGIVASIVTWLLGFDPPDADIKFDWLSANAALESNAYEDVLEEQVVDAGA